MVWLGPDAFHQPDRRGNKLEGFRMLTAREKGSPAGSDPIHWLAVSAVDQIANSIRLGLPGVVRDASPDSIKDGPWTHAWSYSGDPLGVRRMCEMFSKSLTLAPVEELDLAVAGDFYKTPPDEEAGTGWTNTTAGGMIYRGKYCGDEGARRRLVEYLTRIIRRHPEMKSVERVIIVPGTSSRFSEKLGAEVAAELSLPHAAAVRLTQPTQQAKQGHDSYELLGYDIDTNIFLEHVLIVDDVYRSGVTMRSIAQSARNEGALNVVGIVGARTRKSR